MNQILFSYSIHYVISLWAALIFFSAGLLYVDSWKADKKRRIILVRAIGFFLLSLKSSLFAGSYNLTWMLTASQVLAVIGLLLIVFSLLSEPLSFDLKEKAGVFLLTPAVSAAIYPLLIVLYLFTGVIYWRKATEGEEEHSKLIALTFFGFTVSELFTSFQHWTVNVPFWSKLLTNFGFMWNLQYLFQFVSVSLLAYWIWKFVRFRPRVQVLIMTLSIMFVLFITTVIMSMYFLLRSLEGNTYTHLQENNRVLQYLLQTEQDKVIAQGEAIARDSTVQNALLNGDSKTLRDRAENFLSLQKTSTLIIATSSGEVLVRVEDMENNGQKLTDEYIIKQALKGKATGTVAYRQGVPVSQLAVEAAVPIVPRGGNEVSGVVVLGFPIDTVFVDNMKKTSGLDVTVFGKDQRVATTFFAEDGLTRYVGTLETNQNVLQKVLKDGQTFSIKENTVEGPFYGSYLPLKSADNEIIGMSFVGESQNDVVVMAKRAIDLTMLASIALLIWLILPVYFFAKHLERNSNE